MTVGSSSATVGWMCMARATTLQGVVRKTIEQFASLAALMVGLSIALWLLSLVSQA